MEISIKKFENDEGHSWEEMTISFKNYPEQQFLQCELYETPEDALFHRDLIAPSQYVDAIEKAWKAGRDGEPLNILPIEIIEE